jgi:hypothetical protein
MDDNKLRAVQYMDFALNNALGQDSSEAKALNVRREAILKKNEEAVAAAKAAKEAAYKKMEELASKAWPDMAAKFDAQDGFDPDRPPVGKYVRLRGIDNRMGGQFASDEFPFATKINGKPVAGRFDPVVVAALDACEEKFGYRSYPSEWDVIAMVESGTARINEVTTNEVRDAGGSRVGSFDRSTPVEAPIIKIVAIHAGPVAAAAGAGAVSEDGKVEAPKQGAAGSSGSSGSALSSGVASATVSSARAWFMRLLVLVVGLAAAAACLMKANYAPLASIPQAGQVQTRIGGENLAMIGLICAGLGVLFLLLGFIYRGLFTNLAIIAAGLYAALDFLQSRNIVKPEQAAQIRPLGVPIGLTCAALVIVSLLLGLIGLNLWVI